MIIAIIYSSTSLTVDCDYNDNNFWMIGIKYRCFVRNNLNINNPENALITRTTGSHISGKSNNEEMFFHADNKKMQYFPRGLEKFFPNLIGIYIVNGKLKEIHQSDLKAFDKLKSLDLIDNEIDILEDGLFDYNPKLKAISFHYNRIIHIGSNVFDNLNNLLSLSLNYNTCIQMFANSDVAGVQKVIRNARVKCINSEFLLLAEQVKKFETELVNDYYDDTTKIIENYRKLESQLKNSKFSKYLPLKVQVENLKIIIYGGSNRSGIFEGLGN